VHATVSIQKAVGPRLILAWSLIGGLMIWACAGEETTGPGQQQPSAPTVASVVVTPSTATLVSLGETTTLSAAARNSTGGAITGKTFTWNSSNAAVASVSATGTVTAVSNGSATITATVDNVSGTASILVQQDPAGLAVEAGDAQTADAGTAVATAPSVKVSDALGNGVQGVSVTFEVASGGGTVVPTTPVTTNSSGIAAATSWTLGPGLNTLVATTAGGSVTFTATGAGNNYQLELLPGFMVGGLFKGTPVLFGGGLSYGTDASSVLFYNTSTAASDFTGGEIQVLVPGPIADEQTVTVMTEAPNDVPESKTPLGLTIVRETFTYHNPPDDDYVIVRYTISNPGAATVSGLHIGQIMDHDLGVDPAFANNRVEYDAANDVVVITEENTGVHAGHALLSDAVTSYRAWRNPSTPGPNPEDPSTNAGWFSFLSGGIVDPDVSFGPSDIRHVLSHGPVTIGPGASRVVALVLAAGDNRADLLANVAAARAKFASVF